MAFTEGQLQPSLSVNEWLTRYSDGLQRNLPRLVNVIYRRKDPTYLDLSTREVSETRACHMTGSVAQEYGTPEGYQVCSDGQLLRFDTQTGNHMFTITPHVFLYKVEPSGEMQVLDLFAAQAFFPDGRVDAKGQGNQELRRLAEAAPHLITEVGNGIIAVHGTVNEVQRVLGVEHVTYQGFWKKYGRDGIVRSIPNMFMGWSGQQSGQNK